MIRKLAFSVLVAIIGSACGNSSAKVQPDHSVRLSGMVINPQNGLIILEQFVMESNQFLPHDTIPLNTSDHTFDRKVYFKTPGYFRLNLYNKQFISLILDEDDIQIEADGSSQNGMVTITGSSDIDKLTQLSGVIKNFSAQEQELNKKYAQAVSQQNSALSQQLTNEFMDLQDAKNEAIKTEITKMGICLSTVQALNLLDKDMEFVFVNDITKKLVEKYPDVAYVKSLSSQMERLSKIAIGQIAPEIALPNPDGEIVKLSSLRGKYVLVDFWAEWCKPCRLENPNVLRAYNTYKDKGFEVFGVSLDRTKERWIKGIEEDGLPWIQVSDLKYFNSDAAREYNVNAIPFSVLLDKEGRIIAKNLRGKELNDKLQEIFGNL